MGFTALQEYFTSVKQLSRDGWKTEHPAKKKKKKNNKKKHLTFRRQNLAFSMYAAEAWTHSGEVPNV